VPKPIVVGFDPKTTDRAPVEFGVAAARFTGAPLIVASACATHRGASSRRHQVEDDLAGEAGGALAELERELASDDLEISYRELDSTSAARALHETAEHEDAGLLVVGSTGRATLGRLLPGSTADRLMHGAPCAIAVVPTGWTRSGPALKIGVAYLDTPEGHEALRAAHALATRAGGVLRVLTIAKDDLSLYGETQPHLAGQGGGKEVADVEGEHRVAAEKAARAAAAELDGDVEVEVDAFVEDPADSLIRVSEHLDLLVCGSRGYGPLKAVVLGGVSRRVAAEAHCPVIVLPRGVAAPITSLMASSPGAAGA
jgi:nucleotide-binding universal stress UspA family protein